MNYDLPNVPEDYVHRIGRTGRAGAGGEAVSLVCVDELKLLADIEKFIKRKIVSEVVPGFEPDLNAKPQPIQLRSQPGQRSGQRAPAKPASSSARRPAAAGPNHPRPHAGAAPNTAARRSSSGSRGRG